MFEELTDIAQDLAGGGGLLRRRRHVAVVLWQVRHEGVRGGRLPQRLRHQAVHRDVVQLDVEAALPARKDIKLSRGVNMHVGCMNQGLRHQTVHWDVVQVAVQAALPADTKQTTIDTSGCSTTAAPCM